LNMMMPATPPHTPRETTCGFEPPCTPSTCTPSTCTPGTCTGTPTFETPNSNMPSVCLEKMSSALTLSCIPSSLRSTDDIGAHELPQNLDGWEESLLSFLSYMQAKPRRAVTARSPPRTPSKSQRRKTRDNVSPPPAPMKRRFKSALALALEQDDLVAIVELLAKQPMLATMPFFDGTNELPVMRAVRLACDPAIIQLLLDNGAELNSANISQLHRPAAVRL